MDPDIIAEQVRMCAACPKMCRHVCPTFLSWRSDSPTPHGRALILHQEITGTRVLDDRSIELIYQCLECSQCLSMCVTEIDIAEIVEATRIRLVSEKRHPPELDKMQISVVNKYNPFDEPHEERNHWLEVSKTGSRKIIYFTGCTAAYREQQIASDTVSLLESLDYSVFIPEDERCCGSPLLRTGFKEDGRDLAEHNVELLNNLTGELIVATCPGCYKTLTQDYPKLGLEFNKPVKHISELLESHLEDLKSSESNLRITFHDSCHLGRHSGIYDAPRNVISRVSGSQVVEMSRNRENALCCGNGAGFRTLYSDKAKMIGRYRVEQAVEIDADILVTSCPFCKNMLESQARDELIVMDLPQLVRTFQEGLEANTN